MTYPAKQIFNQKENRQQGITLLLAILVLSAILSITFSLATILFIEVRSSADLLKSEGSLYGASSIVEQAIFNIKRETCSKTGEDCVYNSGFANNVSLASSPVVSSTSTAIIQVKIPTGYGFTSSQNIYDFCGGSATTTGCGYGRVTITFKDIGNGSSFFANLCQFDPTFTINTTQSPVLNTYNSVPCTDLNDTSLESYWLYKDVQLSALSNTSVTWDLDPDLQQVLILYNLSASDAYASIKTFDSSKTTAKGLPYVDQVSVDINTVNGVVGRKLKVIVPSR